MKKVVKVIAIIVLVLGGIIAALFFSLDPLEEWAYNKYGKEEVRAYMKKFEPFITLSDDEEEEELVEDPIE